MPFIGRDWRSPGEAWVKTESLGWQRMKIIESQLYPACHQNPACSWPPKSEFGQHMAKHCSRHDCNSSNSSNGFRDSNSRSNSSACSSDSGGSRGSSLSPTPNGSPEKNVHHIYPITVSSPYGRYAYCAHHFDSDSPKSNIVSSHLNAQTMSRSLSRESVQSDNDRAAVNRNQQLQQRLRYNNSVSDFRNSTPDDSDSSSSSGEASTSQISRNLKHSQSENQQNNAEQTSTPSSPILMKNGIKMDYDKELAECKDVNAADNNNKLSRNNSQNQAPTGCTCCCCCCSSANNNQGPQYVYQPKEPYMRTAPHCRISVRTREVAMYNTISEAFYRLDFCNAIHDIRRFNYICKLLHLLITQNLTSLSGCATKVLFTMLEQVAWEVSSNKRNIHVLKNLLNELKQMIQKYYCWGRPIGSSLLWQQHFDTIERISQIVDGIELSPPENNDNDQITFNNLPVEMIHEILLRLNDYRDLVNSAQASPVMRMMIDGQYIWQRLCRYHFTEQQLKLVFENHKGLFVKRKGARGIKYARTTSADGKTSFRNPVTHKSNNNVVPTPSKQTEQTNCGRRNSRQKDSSDDDDGSSHVTRAIRIFDKEGSSTTLGRVKKVDGKEENLTRRVRQSPVANSPVEREQISRSQAVNEPDRQMLAGKQNRPSDSSDRSRNEIDWEHVFHQLRKKFDLKEEYADCLLLCRHCRCLFWKSFGHPCIKNDDSPVSSSGPGGFRLDQQLSNNASRIDDGLAGSQSILPSQQERLAGQVAGHRAQESRLSVAALSRNFDNRVAQNRANDENVAPYLNAFANSNNNAIPRQRMPGSNLNAPLGELNIRIANRRLNDDNNINNNRTGNNNRSSAIRHDELVPKHVAISPQAFLKFFSL